MAAGEIHINDVGLVFMVQVMDDTGPANLSSASTKQFVFQRPDNTIMTVDSMFNTDGTDGTLFYSTASGDLSQIGTWKFQVYLTIGSSVKYSDLNSFRVMPNLPLTS